jgi:hypothetical protein
MRSIRLAGPVLVAVLAVSLVASSTASAAGPLYLTSGRPTFTAPGKGLFIAAPAVLFSVGCQKYSWGGEVSSTTLVGDVFIHFLECEGTNNGGISTCPVMSSGAPLENLVITQTLHGILGLILPKPATGSDVGLLLLPTSGKKWFTLLGSCIPGAVAEGSVAGLVEPVGVLSTTDKITFGVTSGKQNIKDIDLTNGSLVKPGFIVEGEAATLEAADEFTFSAKVEVT